MRITDVRALTFTSPLPRLMGASGKSGPMWRRSAFVVQIETDTGLVGLGEALTLPDVATVLVSRYLKPLLLGEDPTEIPRLWQKLWRRTGYHGGRGYMLEAISAIEIALWDLRGQAEGQPICALLGPIHRREIATYAAGLYWNALPEIVAEAASYAADGFPAVKMKVGMGLEEDERRVRAVRAAIGPSVGLMIDANGAYTAAEAIELARRLADCGIYWFEEPVAQEDLDGYREVRAAAGCRIAGGEGEATRWGFQPLIAGGCIDVVQPDLLRVGGYLEARAVVALAETAGVQVAPHHWCSGVGLAASLHWAAGVRPLELVEYERFPFPLREELIVPPLERTGRHLRVPEAPGLGVRLDPVAAERYLVRAE